MLHTGRECDVSPYSEDYSPVTGVPIVTAATVWQSQYTGQEFLLVFNEALWMPTMPHTLINPNQLRAFGSQVQDNPYSGEPLYIQSHDSSFNMELHTNGTVIFATTRTPTQADLDSGDIPKVELSSPVDWNPNQVKFLQPFVSFEDTITSKDANVSAVSTNHLGFNFLDEELGGDTVFDLGLFSSRVISSATVSNMFGDSEVLSDIPSPPSFTSGNCHSDVSPRDLAERWFISLAQAANTLKKNTQKFIRSATMPLTCRYRADCMFFRKTLAGIWSTDTMDGRIKSLQGNCYAQVFANKGYFSKVYPLGNKSEAGDALKTFCAEFGVPEKLVFDGSKEQTGKNTEFMKQIKKHGIDFHIAKAERHNEVPAEGVICELRRKWFCVMIRQRVPNRLWDYGFKWVSEINSMIYSGAGGNTDVPLAQVTGETPDISEYLDFGFYDRAWFYENAGLGPRLPCRWLGVLHRTGCQMCYFVLKSNGEVLSRGSVQRVTNLELEEKETVDIFADFDKTLNERLKHDDGKYDREKPSLEHWADMASDPEFVEEFQKVYDNPEIPEADNFSPEMLEDTYLNMELAMHCGDDGPEFARITKQLRDANGIPIGTSNDNPLLDTRVYEVEYLDGYKASLSANEIAQNLFAQVDKDGNWYVFYDQIIDHRKNGSFVQALVEGERKRQQLVGNYWFNGRTAHLLGRS